MKSQLLLAAVIVTALSASKKNDVSTKKTVLFPCSITSIEANHNGETNKIFLTYGNNGTITRLDIGSKHSTTNFTTYTYQQGQITVYSQDSSENGTTHYTLDATNKVVFAQDGHVKGTFKYNKDEYLIESVMTFPERKAKLTFKCSYTDGNLTKIIEHSRTGTRCININYSSEPTVDLLGFENPLSYYNYVLYDFCDGVLIREGYFGKKSKNLMTSGSSPNSKADNNYNIALSYTKENDKIIRLKYNSDWPTYYKLNYSCK